MSLLTYLFGKGYTGGPDFSRVEAFHFDMDDIGLELTVPDSNIQLPPGKRDTYIPFRSHGWFDNHCKQSSNHFYLPVFTELWAYCGPYWKVHNEPFGMLSVRIAIKRALPGKILDPSNLDTLAGAIRWDYEWYFEVEEPGKYGRGKNRQVRQEVEETYRSRHPAIPEEDKLRQKETLLRKRLRELPTQFETRRYGDQTWLYYALNKEPAYPSHYYCQVLDEQYYLHVRFSYRVDFSNYFHIWKADAEAAEQRIIETVKLRFPGNATPT